MKLRISARWYYEHLCKQYHDCIIKLSHSARNWAFFFLYIPINTFQKKCRAFIKNMKTALISNLKENCWDDYNLAIMNFKPLKDSKSHLLSLVLDPGDVVVEASDQSLGQLVSGQQVADLDLVHPRIGGRA